jgi:hypothetical protein
MAVRSFVVVLTVIALCASSAGCRKRTRTRTVYVDTNGGSSGALQVLSPDRGESWLIGTTQSVTWVAEDASSLVDIEFSLDGASWSPLVLGTANDGSQPVTTPGTPDASVRVRVTERSSGASDASDADFAFAGIVVTSPDGGETWLIGGTAAVTWEAAGFAGAVDVHFTPDGATWLPLALATPNDGSESVPVPVAPSTTARVRVSGTSGALADESDADFTVQDA